MYNGSHYLIADEIDDYVYTVNVNNYKKPEEKEKKVVEEENINVTGKKEVALPRTGF